MFIEGLIQVLAQKYGVRFYRKAIVGNHLHFILRIHNRETFKSFVRVLSGKIASHIMNGESFATFITKVASIATVAGEGVIQTTIADDGCTSALRAGDGAKATGEVSNHSKAASDRPTQSLRTGEGSMRAHETQGKGQRFWQFRPFSRVMSWGRDFKNGCKYVVQNTLEALGFIPYKPRRNHYAQWTQTWIEKVALRFENSSYFSPT
jgi:hypothetical protein